MSFQKERRKIYLRCFALLLALWLALMAVFSWRLLQSARAEGERRFLSSAQGVQRELVNAWAASGGALEAYNWQHIVSRLEVSGYTASLFTYEGQPVWTPGDPARWTLTLGGSSPREEVSAEMDPTWWFDFEAVSREMDALAFPRQAALVLEDVLLTPEGEAVPGALLLRYNHETVATFTNGSFDRYEGEPYAQCQVDFPVDALEAVRAAECREDIRRMQSIAAGAVHLMEILRNDPTESRMTDYTIRRASRSPWDGLDCAYVTVVGFGPVVQDTWRETPDSLPVSYAHPAYWLVLAGRSDVWGGEGAYWLCCVLASLTGFLAAAWLLAHSAWKGQKACLLYQRRTQETANAIAHRLKTPLSILHASAENLEANICPEKQREYIAEIVHRTEAMDQVLLDILELAEPAAKPSAPQ